MAGRRRPTWIFDSRRLVRLLEPSVELRLPLYVVTATAVFMGLLAWNGASAFQRMTELALADTPSVFRSALWAQTQNFLVVSAALIAGYVVTVVATCLAFTHRLIGPRVALRRQIESLKNGDYAARVTLRDSDVVLRDLGDDLNELARILEENEKGWG